MPADALRMNIDYNKLIAPGVVGGLGGNTVCYQEPAVLIFNEPNRNLIRYYFIKIMIPALNRDLMRMPPIVGRDILDQWRMNYDPSKNSLSFTVRSANHTVKTL